MKPVIKMINMALEFEEFEQPISSDEECEDAIEM